VCFRLLAQRKNEILTLRNFIVKWFNILTRFIRKSSNHILNQIWTQKNTELAELCRISIKNLHYFNQIDIFAKKIS
jgi:hypothetical protein